MPIGPAVPVCYHCYTGVSVKVERIAFSWSIFRGLKIIEENCLSILDLRANVTVKIKVSNCNRCLFRLSSRLPMRIFMRVKALHYGVENGPVFFVSFVTMHAYARLLRKKRMFLQQPRYDPRRKFLSNRSLVCTPSFKKRFPVDLFLTRKIKTER